MQPVLYHQRRYKAGTICTRISLWLNKTACKAFSLLAAVALNCRNVSTLHMNHMHRSNLRLYAGGALIAWAVVLQVRLRLSRLLSLPDPQYKSIRMYSGLAHKCFSNKGRGSHIHNPSEYACLSGICSSNAIPILWAVPKGLTCADLRRAATPNLCCVQSPLVLPLLSHIRCPEIPTHSCTVMITCTRLLSLKFTLEC